MDLAELFSPTNKKLWVAVIVFLVLPNVLFNEETDCGPWYSPWTDGETDCTSYTETIFVPFFGVMWLMAILLDFTLFFEMLAPFIIQIIISYVVACLVVEYFMKPGKKLKGK